MKHLLIGSNSDIGKKIAENLLNGGHEVYGVSRTESTVRHPSYHHLVHDIVQQGELPEGFVPEGLDGLVYLPGTILLKPFRALKDEQFMEDFMVNFMGAVRAIRQTHRTMNEGGAILLFSTVAVQTGMPYHASIASAKGAIEGLTRSLAAEFAPKIRVNCIAPSLTDTKLAERLLNSPERREGSADRHPLKKVGTTSDMAEMAQFLLSDRSAWISGQVLRIDGGISTLRK
jgi:NAD(P)-dependent dehydrogenase (short-subunit alcohol dehydrogenase family)